MKYDREWLADVQRTQGIIPTIQDLIAQIPDRSSRVLMEQQFKIAKNEFTGNLALGHGVQKSIEKIYDLAALASDLLPPGEDDA